MQVDNCWWQTRLMNACRLVCTVYKLGIHNLYHYRKEITSSLIPSTRAF